MQVVQIFILIYKKEIQRKTLGQILDFLGLLKTYIIINF